MLSRLLAWASQAPQRPAILTDQKTLTYQDLVEQILAYQPQESISYPTLIVKRDCFQQLIAFCYHLQHGNYPLICHPNLPEEEQRRLSSCDPPSDKADFAVLSSGSTGRPKVFWRSWASWSDFFEQQNQLFHFSEQTRLFSHGSLSFTGNLNLALAQLWAGGCLVFSDQRSFKGWSSVWRRQKVTHLYLLPSLLQRLLPYISADSYFAPYLLTSSQHLSPELIRSYYQRFPQLELLMFYGASELSFISWCQGFEAMAIAGFVGRPFPQVKLELREGYIFVQTPYAIEGIEQPYSVDDVGEMTAAGLILKGRTKDWVNQQGVKCHLPSLVQLVHQSGVVQEAAAIKGGSSAADEHVILCLVLKKQRSLTAVKAYLEAHLSPAQLPKRYMLLKELPLNDSGKVDSRRLSQLANKPSNAAHNTK
ncbi:AMP-binding protein [Streptococcus equi]|uniref:AMP-binding protein n=1 Tax=Streptococcus equi TaxID=1336 RepID=UPI0013F67994|nr:AMP-binding protein [Streptococcus equi]